MIRKSLLLLLSVLFFQSSGFAQTPEQTKLFEKLELLAQRDNAKALYHIGMMYHLGIGTEVNIPRAKHNFEKAMALGDPLAAYKLGCYYDGQAGSFVETDLAKALKYKLVAADAGYALAQNDVGKLYYDAGDYVRAKAYLRKAVDQGYQGAILAMASIHNSDEGMPKAPAVTAAYFTIFLTMNDGGNNAQKKWLADFNKKLSSEDFAIRDKIISSWRANPNDITLEALSGLRAAEILVAANPPD